MQLGMIGLGRMGANMSRRLVAAGHEVVGFDVNEQVRTDLADEGVLTAVGSLEELVASLDQPRNLWVMLPAVFVDATMESLADLLSPDDTLIDGGNSLYRDDVDRAVRLGP